MLAPTSVNVAPTVTASHCMSLNVSDCRDGIHKEVRGEETTKP